MNLRARTRRSVAVLLFCATASAQPVDVALKARYLLNFAEFVEWPAEAFTNENMPLVVGVMGDDAILNELRELQVRRVAGRKVEVQEFNWGQFADKSAPIDQRLCTCHILFIGRAENRLLPAVFNKIRGKRVLTVGDSPSFTRKYFSNQMCGIIDFFDTAGILGIEVNLDAAERAKLKVSSQLLRLVKVVYPEDAQPQAAR
jgi:hypothetical protein